MINETGNKIFCLIYQHVLLLFFACLITIISLQPSHISAEENGKENVYGQYPPSMLIAARTAATYSANLYTFSLIFNDYNYDKMRSAVDGDMHSLPSGMHYRRTTLSLWGEYGLTNNWQFGIGLPYVHRDYKNEAANKHDVNNGLGDILLYTKYKVVSEDSVYPAISVDLWLKTSSGDKTEGLGNGELDTKITAEISKRINNISLHLNPEYTFTGGDRGKLGNSADDKKALNLGVIYHFSPTVVPMAEINALWWGRQGNEVDIGGGVLFFLGKSSSLKLGVSVPVSVDMPYSASWAPWIRLATWL